jgi:two-component system, NtrC family, sensor histidine kinase HydH
MSAHPLSVERALVVDDEPHIRRSIADGLAQEGCEAVLCSTADEALAVFAPGAFALAFVALNLPGMSGLSLASILRERDPACDVVVITSFGTITDTSEALKIGVCDFLRKPFALEDLRFCLRRSRQRQRLHERICAAEHRYAQLVQSIPLVIFVLRRDFQLEFINRGCKTILGYPETDAIGTPNWLLERIHLKDRAALQVALQAIFAAGDKAFSLECRMRHAKGHLIHTLIKSIPAAAAVSGAIERIEGSIVDITERVFWEKALVHQEKIKTLGAIAAEVAHEIRNPLVSIGGFAQRLQNKFPDLPEAGIILRESHRLEKLLSWIKGYLRPIEVHLQTCAVPLLLSECLDLLAPELEQKRIAHRLLLTPAPSPVRADPDMLRQVFINLIRNAIAAMESGGTLTIASHESEQSLHVEFRNLLGAGTALVDPEEIFLPFADGGQSIGLPLSNRLLKSMGGMLSYTHDRSAVVFTVSLPKYLSSPAAASVPPAADPRDSAHQG